MAKVVLAKVVKVLKMKEVTNLRWPKEIQEWPNADQTAPSLVFVNSEEAAGSARSQNCHVPGVEHRERVLHCCQDDLMPILYVN